jgi:hypothetical protein
VYHPGETGWSRRFDCVLAGIADPSRDGAGVSPRKIPE